MKSFKGVVEDKAENKIRAQIMGSVKGSLKNMDFFFLISSSGSVIHISHFPSFSLSLPLSEWHY